MLSLLGPEDCSIHSLLESLGGDTGAETETPVSRPLCSPDKSGWLHHGSGSEGGGGSRSILKSVYRICLDLDADYERQTGGPGVCSSAVEHLPSMPEALGLVPSTASKKGRQESRMT
jgi:hypothetical protein